MRLMQKSERKSGRRPEKAMRGIIQKVMPGLVDRIAEGENYRSRAPTEREAITSAILKIRAQHFSDFEFLDNDFLSSESKEEANRTAALLVLMRRWDALPVFRKALFDKRGEVRAAAAAGLSDIIRTSADEKEQLSAIMTIEKAANKGSIEARHEIDNDLADFFRERPGLRGILSAVAYFGKSVIRTPAFKIAGTTAAAIAMMYGAEGLGGLITCICAGAHYSNERSG